MSDKDRTQKNALEFTFDEFVTWATGYVFFGIAEGTALRTLMFTIVDHAVRNEVFGGGKPKGK